MEIQALAQEIREYYQSNPHRSEEDLEAYLDQKLGDRTPEQRIHIMEGLMKEFGHLQPFPQYEDTTNTFLLRDLLTKLLGEKAPESTLSAQEMVKRLAQALNTIFDSLNQLIGGINATLMGKRMETETIRFVIGSQIGGGSASISLQDYIDQIKEAFSIAHKAFQEAARTKFKEILVELDPEKLEKSIEGGIKFGPLRKAELFDLYKEKFRTLKNWLETGLLMEATLREFEKTCQKLYSQKGGTK